MFSELRSIVDSPDATLSDLVYVAHAAGEIWNAWAEVKLRCERTAGKLLSDDDLQKPLSDSDRAELEQLESIVDNALKGVQVDRRGDVLQASLEVAERGDFGVTQ